MRTPKAQIYRAADGGYRWRLRAANSQIVAVSGESYASKSNAIRAWERTGQIFAASWFVPVEFIE